MKKSNQKILLVDDNPKNLQVAMNILKDYNVIYAQSGQKALNLVDEYDFDLILLDIMMPGLSGYDVCKKLKADVNSKNIPIIFLTVKDDEKDIVEGFDLGAVDYIVKPFYSEVLLKRVELHLKLSQSINDLKLLNENLNDIVNRQIEDIRKKDEILFKQSKDLALNEMVNMMSEQLSNPLGLLKMQNQALEIKNIDNNITNDDIENIVGITNKELNFIDVVLQDFDSFFNQNSKAEVLNLKVMIDSALLFFRDISIKEKIQININGDINENVSFVKSQLKHVFIKLITTLTQLLKEHKIKDKHININFENREEYIYFEIEANICDINEYELQNCFTLEYLENKNSLGLHLVKMLLEKNLSDINITKKDDSISFIINFYK